MLYCIEYVWICMNENIVLLKYVDMKIIFIKTGNYWN